MISKECREAIDKAIEILKPFSNYKFVEKAMEVLSWPVLREDRKIAYKEYKEKEQKGEKELLDAFEKGKTIQYCYSRNRDKNPRIWDDLPKEKVRSFIEHGQWEYMRIKDPD